MTVIHVDGHKIRVSNIDKTLIFYAQITEGACWRL